MTPHKFRARMRRGELYRRVKAYFEAHHGETVYVDDVALALDISTIDVETAVKSLLKDGKIAEDKGGVGLYGEPQSN